MELVIWVPGDPPENLMVAAAANGDVGIVKEQLSLGVDVNAVDTRWKQTALHAAADRGHKKIVGCLLTHGAYLNPLDNNNMTPLMQACSSGHNQVAVMLIRAGADVSHERAGDGMTALKFALWGRCSSKVVKLLLNNGAKVPEPGFRIVHLDSGSSFSQATLRKWILRLVLWSGLIAWFAIMVVIYKGEG